MAKLWERGMGGARVDEQPVQPVQPVQLSLGVASDYPERQPAQ